MLADPREEICFLVQTKSKCELMESTIWFKQKKN